jgi:hypothetical protein
VDRYPYFHIERCYNDPLLLGVINVEKRLGPFDIRKVPESPKHEKQANLLHSVKPNERGSFRKSRESMENM